MTLRIPASADELRREFDESFSRPLQPPQEAGEPFLIASVRGSPIAFHLHGVKGVERTHSCAALPSTHPHFLGLASLRGGVVPLFDIAGLWGERSLHRRASLVVLLDAGGGETAGVVVDHLEGYRSLASSSLCPSTDSRPPFKGVLPDGSNGIVWVDAASVVTWLRNTGHGTQS